MDPCRTLHASLICGFLCKHCASILFLRVFVFLSPYGLLAQAVIETERPEL